MLPLRKITLLYKLNLNAKQAETRYNPLTSGRRITSVTFHEAVAFLNNSLVLINDSLKNTKKLSIMKVIEKSTGDKKDAIYITTGQGNKRFSVDGKVYSDKNFDKNFGVIPPLEETPIVWQSLIRQLFDEVLTNVEQCWILEQPLRITMNILGEMASYAVKVKDEKMIGYFCRLGLYTFSDPTDAEYDQERANYYISLTVK